MTISVDSSQVSDPLFRKGKYICTRCQKQSEKPKTVMIGSPTGTTFYCKCGGKLKEENGRTN